LDDAFFRPDRGVALTNGQVEGKIRQALDAQGYVERSYYAVPEGFAIVTRLEQFEADGTSKQPPARWAASVGPLRKFSLGEYLAALFEATPGYYRVIVFIVTPIPFAQADAKVSQEQAARWLNSGANVLPRPVADCPYTPEHICTALIYEFQQPDRKERAKFVDSGLPAREHLIKAKIWDRLQ
jgi:hypothetical protein